MSTQAFSKWLQQQLDMRGLLAADLSRETNIDSSTISRWMSPPFGKPSPASCLEIARALRIDASEVLRAAGRLPAMAEDSAPYVAREIDARAISIARILANDPERLEEWIEIGEVFVRRSSAAR